MSLVVGLTGGIGSGKSAVSNAFAALGVDVTDTDVLAHALAAPGEPGHAAVLAAFGPAFRRPDGTLDRSRLRQLVFDDATARARLEAILHPLIRAAARREIHAWAGPYGLLVVPLLYERGGLWAVDRVLVVDCPEDEQVRRVMGRSGLPAADVRAIMATQLPAPTAAQPTTFSTTRAAGGHRCRWPNSTVATGLAARRRNRGATRDG
jgi:dephospho-CoA kinase